MLLFRAYADRKELLFWLEINWTEISAHNCTCLMNIGSELEALSCQPPLSRLLILAPSTRDRFLFSVVLGLLFSLPKQLRWATNKGASLNLWPKEGSPTRYWAHCKRANCICSLWPAPEQLHGLQFADPGVEGDQSRKRQHLNLGKFEDHEHGPGASLQGSFPVFGNKAPRIALFESQTTFILRRSPVPGSVLPLGPALSVARNWLSRFPCLFLYGLSPKCSLHRGHQGSLFSSPSVLVCTAPSPHSTSNSPVVSPQWLWAPWKGCPSLSQSRDPLHRPEELLLVHTKGCPSSEIV